MIFMVMYFLVFIIFGLVAISVMQIKLAGIQVKDFMGFIKANEILDKLYKFAEIYEKLTPIEQILYLQEAEKVFTAFEKVPDILWEEEYQKYMKVLNTYKDIKILRWQS